MLGTFAPAGFAYREQLDAAPVTDAGLASGNAASPEPGSLALLGAGLLSMALVLRRRIGKL